jgi:cytochrome c-type biogenesis protein CcmH/NrfF
MRLPNWVKTAQALLLGAPSIPRSLRKGWESTNLAFFIKSAQALLLGAPSIPRSLRNGWESTNLAFFIKSARALLLGAPSIPRSLRNGWESTNLAFFIKSAQALLLAIAVVFSMAASGASARQENLGHRLMCQCGCAQILGECDHYGCPDRDTELAALSAGIATGASDQQILDAFVAKYGAIVLAAPTTHGFDLVAWIAPFAVFAAALLGTILLIRRWSGVAAVQAPAAAAAPATGDPDDRDRRERIRRETGAEGGY